MSHSKETPRQKMISLMYLVLTCLLALNVSREVLDGFVSINESLETTNANFKNNSQKMTEAMQEAIKQGRYEFVPYFSMVEKARGKTQRTITYLDSLKKEVIRYTEDKAGADTLLLSETDKLDDYDKPTYLLIGSDETKSRTGKYSASELRMQLVVMADSLLGQLEMMQQKDGLRLPLKDYQILKDKLRAFKPQDQYKDKEGNAITWEYKQFYNQPMAAVITGLSKMQSDIRNLEGELISAFASAPGKLAVPFNELKARIVPVSQYVQAGTPYTADVFLSAASTHFKDDNLQFILGDLDTVSGRVMPGATILPLDKGTGKILLPTNQIGNQEIKGWIKFREGTGSYKYLPFQSQYVVAQAAVAVSAEKMNLFYASVENPLSVSAAGVAPSNLVVNIQGCNGSIAAKGNGKYSVMVKGNGTCTITVFEKQNGSLKQQGGPQIFRVKKLPNPVLKLNATPVMGSIDFKKAEAKSITYVQLDQSGFEFNAPFRLEKFTFCIGGQGVGYEEHVCEGNRLSPQALAALSRAKPGCKLYFESIKVIAPDGPRELPMVKVNVR